MTNVRVYKTDVDDGTAGKTIVDAICRHLPGCNASFDFGDCDNVLRVESIADEINEPKIKNILQNYGYQIEKLP